MQSMCIFFQKSEASKHR